MVLLGLKSQGQRPFRGLEGKQFGWRSTAAGRAVTLPWAGPWTGKDSHQSQAGICPPLSTQWEGHPRLRGRWTCSDARETPSGEQAAFTAQDGS